MKAHHVKTSTTNLIQKGDAVLIYQSKKKKVRKTKRYYNPITMVHTHQLIIPHPPSCAQRFSDGKFLTKSVDVHRLKKGHTGADVPNWNPIPVADEDEDASQDDLPGSSFADDKDGQEDVLSDDDTPPPVSGSSASNTSTLVNPHPHTVILLPHA